MPFIMERPARTRKLSHSDRQETQASGEEGKLSKWFDRFADRVAAMVAHVGFFSFCVFLVLVWLPSYFVIGNSDTWQLVINTTTTIITFLLVALLHNTQHRGQQTQDARLKEIIDKLDGAHDPAKED